MPLNFGRPSNLDRFSRPLAGESYTLSPAEIEEQRELNKRDIVFNFALDHRNLDAETIQDVLCHLDIDLDVIEDVLSGIHE